MDEFGFIANHLAPLARKEKGALGLKDDAAVLAVPRGSELIVTKDALTEGVHFVGDEPPGLLARKLLRVNLSDLAAMGAQPWGYFLALMLPESMDAAWLAAFAEGLRLDQKTFGITLMGGDTTRAQGTLSMCITALGLAPKGTALKRGGAKAGDGLYVSGTIGDGALGLKLASGQWPVASKNTDHRSLTTHHYLLQRYRLPRPRLALGQALRGIATAAIDISDGLMQDLGHICAASKVSAEIRWEDVPLSTEARVALAVMGNSYDTVLAGGDDYELLFTAPMSAERRLKAISRACGVPVTRIGRVGKGKGARAFDANGAEIMLTRKGWRHF